MDQEIVILDCARTAIGTFGGSLSETPASDLGAHVIREAAGEVRVLFPDGFSSPARVVQHDADWDLAALSVYRPSASPLSASDNEIPGLPSRQRCPPVHGERQLRPPLSPPLVAARRSTAARGSDSCDRRSRTARR